MLRPADHRRVFPVAAKIPHMVNPRPILFYDGECGLCDRTVQWMLKRDLRHVVDYAPLQGTTYAAIPLPDKPTDLGTVVFYDRGVLLVRSNAVLGALRCIGGVWGPLAAIALILPRSFRDWMYNFVARRRLRWFGGKDSCKIPSRADRSRFLP